MNQEEREHLLKFTCHIIEKYDAVEEKFKAGGLPKKWIKKLDKAFDLIYEVNQKCFDKK